MAFGDHWGLPKNAKDFFSPKKEAELKNRYGFWYWVHTVCSVVLLLVPFVVFMTMTPEQALEPATQTGNLLGAMGVIIGLLGSFAIGVGLVNIFSVLIKQYLGHWVTVLSIGAGLLLDGLGILLFMFVR